jgi:hypothetical protein
MRKSEFKHAIGFQLCDRKLLYVVVMSGDGNYHLHAMKRVKDLIADPSVYGDYGFFCPYKVARKYTEWADNNTSKHAVSQDNKAWHVTVC